jgi:hypothetical protein
MRHQLLSWIKAKARNGLRCLIMRMMKDVLSRNMVDDANKSAWLLSAFTTSPTQNARGDATQFLLYNHTPAFTNHVLPCQCLQPLVRQEFRSGCYLGKTYVHTMYSECTGSLIQVSPHQFKIAYLTKVMAVHGGLGKCKKLSGSIGLMNKIWAKFSSWNVSHVVSVQHLFDGIR